MRGVFFLEGAHIWCGFEGTRRKKGLFSRVPSPKESKALTKLFVAHPALSKSGPCRRGVPVLQSLGVLEMATVPGKRSWPCSCLQSTGGQTGRHGCLCGCHLVVDLSSSSPSYSSPSYSSPSYSSPSYSSPSYSSPSYSSPSYSSPSYSSPSYSSPSYSSPSYSSPSYSSPSYSSPSYSSPYFSSSSLALLFLHLPFRPPLTLSQHSLLWMDKILHHLETMVETMAGGYLQRSHHSRDPWVVQDFVHPPLTSSHGHAS